MVTLWKLTGQGSEEVHLPDLSSLDAATNALPEGLYSTFRTFHHRTHVLDLKTQLDRLYLPAAKMGLHPSADPAQLRRELADRLDAYPADEARVRISLTQQGQVYLALEPLKLLPRSVYEQGVRVVQTQAHRENPTLKSTAFIAASQAERAQLAEQNAFEGLIVQDGLILECLTSNFFYVRDGKLGTAARGILNGVTRHEVLHIARTAGIEIVYEPLPILEAGKIDEAFLTSSSRGIVPIVDLDGVQVGSGQPGELTRRLMALYEADVERRVEVIRP
jgi:branched-chain amino acid aminotransferase